MAKTSTKIHPLPSLRDLRKFLRRQGKKVVFTNGCFDLLHVGHIRYLEAASELGDFLIIAVNSDRSVRTIKGPERPINTSQYRAEALAALGFVSAVTVFDESTPLKIICELEPDVLVKGADWPLEQIVGREEVEAGGGKVVRIPLTEGISTSGIIEKIKNLDHR